MGLEGILPFYFIYFSLFFSQNKPHVRNLSARNSGAENGCANFMGAWHFWFFLLENTHAHIIPRFAGGGGGWKGGGGSADVIFMALISSFFLSFSKDKGRQLQCTGKRRKFTPTLSAPPRSKLPGTPYETQFLD